MNLSRVLQSSTTSSFSAFQKVLLSEIIRNSIFLKVSPLSTFTPVCYLSFGTLTYVTEQTHQILEIYFCMNERKLDVSDETRLCWNFFLAVLAYCCDVGREYNSGQHTAFVIFALEIGDTSWIFDPLNQHSSKSFTEFFTTVSARFIFFQVHFM